MEFTRLENRSIVAVEGEDRLTFLQGLISNDVTKLSAQRAIWAGFLSPQGKFQFDLFLSVRGEALLIEVEADRQEAFVKRLGIFKLRSRVHISPAPDLTVWAAWGGGVEAAFGLSRDAGSASPMDGGTVFVDPRLSAAGLRLVLPADRAETCLKSKGLTEASFAQWDRMRLDLGLPDGSRDMQIDGNLLLELGFEELGGVDFKKGCYMGQENTTRSKHRNLIKRRLVQVRAESGACPPSGTPILLRGEEVGQMRSSVQNIGLALIRLAPLKAAETAPGLVCGGTALTPCKPAWAEFPEVE